MMDFIYKLYNYDNFTLYLTIAIVVLIILFFVVLVFGKKDQKLEETKRLQKIDLDLFKEEKKLPETVEIVEEKDSELDKTLVNIPLIEEEKPNVLNTEEVEVTTFKPAIEEKIEEEKYEAPTIKIEEEVNIPELAFDDISNSLEKELSDLEQIKNEFHNIEVPKVEDTKKPDVTLRPYQANSQVFSSVFVGKQNEAEEVKEDNESVIKIEEIKEEEPVIEPVTPVKTVEIAEDEDDDFDLPVLKEEPKEEVVEETKEAEEKPQVSEDTSTFSFDDLIGETYKIK